MTESLCPGICSRIGAHLRSPSHEERDHQTDRHPRGAKQLCSVREVQPDESAYEKTAHRNHGRKRHFLRRPELVMDESGEVHAHEGNEGAEIQKFRATLETEQKTPGQSDEAEQQNVVTGNAGSRADRCEEPARERILAAMP